MDLMLDMGICDGFDVGHGDLWWIFPWPSVFVTDACCRLWISDDLSFDPSDFPIFSWHRVAPQFFWWVVIRIIRKFLWVRWQLDFWTSGFSDELRSGSSEISFGCDDTWIFELRVFLMSCDQDHQKICLGAMPLGFLNFGFFWWVVIRVIRNFVWVRWHLDCWTLGFSDELWSGSSENLFGCDDTWIVELRVFLMSCDQDNQKIWARWHLDIFFMRRISAKSIRTGPFWVKIIFWWTLVGFIRFLVVLQAIGRGWWYVFQ